MRNRPLLSLGAALLLAPLPAAAQWSVLPNGLTGFETSYSTSAVFSCAMFYVTSGNCTASGNQAVLSNAGGTLTVTFHGLGETPLLVTNATQVVPIGSMELSMTGTAPTLPTLSSGAAWPLTMRLTIAGRSGDVHYRRPLGSSELLVGACCGLGSGGYFVLGLPPQPPGQTYGALVYDRFTIPAIVPGDQSIPMFANVGIVPEPSTWALLGTGLLGLGGVALRRRRQAA